LALPGSSAEAGSVNAAKAFANRHTKKIKYLLQNGCSRFISLQN
jgi:hypothetical protein